MPVRKMTVGEILIPIALAALLAEAFPLVQNLGLGVFSLLLSLDVVLMIWL